jgi:hypothetical protein
MFYLRVCVNFGTPQNYSHILPLLFSDRTPSTLFLYLRNRTGVAGIIACNRQCMSHLWSSPYRSQTCSFLSDGKQPLYWYKMQYNLTDNTWQDFNKRWLSLIMSFCLLLLLRRYCPLCALASLMILLHRSLSCDVLHHTVTVNILRSFNTESGHLSLGLPFFLLPSGWEKVSFLHLVYQESKLTK